MPMFFLSFFLLLYIFLITFSQSFTILLITFSQSFMLLSGVTEIVANTSEVKILIAHVIQKQFSQKIIRKSLFNLFFFLFAFPVFVWLVKQLLVNWILSTFSFSVFFCRTTSTPP